MCLIPKDKLEIYIKSMFHMSLFGKKHARLPYHHFNSADQYPDTLQSVLGRSEISFTFTLSDNITYRKYNVENGEVSNEVYEGRTMDIGQEGEDG